MIRIEPMSVRLGIRSRAKSRAARLARPVQIRLQVKRLDYR
jgi:hypothetical protein